MDALGRRYYKGTSEIYEVFNVISGVIFGPNFKWEISDSAEDKLVMMITRCPLLKEVRGKEQYAELSEACQSYCRSAVENLNPRCTQIYTKRMCSGDGYCENVISIRE
ncbi:MAG: hypothetical protein WCY97_05730 [Methanothrix sp.]|uniref:Uncharacterized protein n=1 Tax=Methanothrix harundinacea TaxID=301375 RepID=A0A101FU42_9EURY|nr:MAG: Uncharacterized protein XD72_1128 [Methanothrix harundinacea]MDD3709924.1 hypothetical protein [Methanothrix sp.]MDI9398955.1 hypothetical protein [Euryarchaeota archaeon]KUK95636.1 MAG: Uncharacterized protein XE07_1712 [Methanothrix harundinacea]MCP1392640.1 hypothetical protein [Methanothrix harundinacea]